MLHGLSPEIQTLILLQLESTKSLSVLIHTSPYLFTVYLTSKQKILSTCVQREIETEVLPIATAAAKISSLPRGSDKTTVIDSIRYLDTLDTTESMVRTLPISISIHLSRLYRTVNFVIKDFVEYIRKTTERYEFYSS